MSLKCTLLIASIISICTITHSELLKRVLAWKRWPSKLPLFAPHSESILPSDTEREFVNGYWILYFIMLMLMNSFSDYDKNLELAQLVQQKLDAYKVQIPNTHIYSIANINQSLLLTKFIFLLMVLIRLMILQWVKVQKKQNHNWSFWTEDSILQLHFCTNLHSRFELAKIISTKNSN